MTNAADGLPGWMMVGANVVVVTSNRHHADVVQVGVVSRVLARDIVIADTNGAELERVHRSDYRQREDHYERWSRGRWDSSAAYVFRADDPRAVAAGAKAVMRRNVKHLKDSVGKVDIGTAADAFDAIAAAAAHLAGLARERPW
ncbi:hypothetical protein [Mycobacteroides salmoniphilum]|uniref:hypothetical protein n=1 Tax=Mycobacteroides salmoniphilum TaxID=404941 RepID=UPI0010656475|nr:hypothetical protein [Mycobacteroides salmoniphilum]TDZ94797.1 hypothetical protein CCUG62472_01611 [Mycobacteroides salmoniphilum]